MEFSHGFLSRVSYWDSSSYSRSMDSIWDTSWYPCFTQYVLFNEIHQEFVPRFLQELLQRFFLGILPVIPQKISPRILPGISNSIPSQIPARIPPGILPRIAPETPLAMLSGVPVEFNMLHFQEIFRIFQNATSGWQNRVIPVLHEIDRPSCNIHFLTALLPQEDVWAVGQTCIEGVCD